MPGLCWSDGADSGPPLILGGSGIPRLASAYDHLDNGHRLRTHKADGGLEWAGGAWYLNDNPITDTFFAQTWIPATGDAPPAESGAIDSGAAPPTIALIAIGPPAVPSGLRAFPLPPRSYRFKARTAEASVAVNPIDWLLGQAGPEEHGHGVLSLVGEDDHGFVDPRLGQEATGLLDHHSRLYLAAVW